MSHVRSTGSAPGSVTVYDDFEPEEVVAGPPPKPKPEGAGTPGTENTVERASSPSTRPLRASGEAKAPPLSATAQAAVKLAEKHLVRSVQDPIVSDRDVEQITAGLARLSPRDFRAAIEALQRADHLEVYFGNMEPRARHAFMRLAVEKGLLSESADRPASGSCSPPTAPGLIAQPGEVPSALGGAVHEENLGRIRHYYEEYEAYRDRYVAAMKASPDFASMRALGAHQKPAGFTATGVDTAAHQLAFSRTQMALEPSQLPFAEAIADRSSALTGKRRAGSLALEAEFQSQFRDVGGSFQVSGRTDGGIEAKGALLESRESRGEFTMGEKRKHGSDGSIKTSTKVGHSSGTGASVGDDGSVEVTLGAGKVGKSGAGLSSYVKADDRHAVYGGGVELGAKLSDQVKVKVRVGVSMQGMTPDEVRQVIVGEGFFDRPPELDRGQAWGHLSAKRRDELSRNGWTEREWESLRPSPVRR